MNWLSSALWVMVPVRSCIVVHTVDVFGAEIKQVSYIFDSGY